MNNLSHTQKPVPIAVVGARGYSGLELTRILLRHPGAELRACYATSAFPLEQYLPEDAARMIVAKPVSSLMDEAGEYKVVFLATPAPVSMELAPQLLQRGCHVIDLSGAFRLQAGSTDQQSEAYRQWYGVEHTATNELTSAIYGLVPWHVAQSGMNMNAPQPLLIANPGCYATAVLMALIPLLKNGLTDPGSVVIDAKSGVSGAGKKANEALLFHEVAEDFKPYKIARHQHLPEITQWACFYSGVELDPFFSTHLLPVRRGILAGIYAKLSAGVAGLDSQEAEEKLLQIYSAAYEGYPLIRIARSESETGTSLLSIKSVARSARTHMALKVQGEKLYLHSAIDNLVKGAAGQAIENFNALAGWPVETSLMEMEGGL